MSNNNFLGNVIDNIANRASLDERATLVPVSLRLNEKNTAMLEVFTELNQGKAPLHILPGQFSQALAQFLLSNKTNADLLEQMFKDREFAEDSGKRGALNVLISRGAVGFKSNLDLSEIEALFEPRDSANSNK